MAAADRDCCRADELWRRLDAVNDPELDVSIVDMGFVERAEIGPDGHVEVDFRLPTYWCSPNFAYLMLDGIRRALEALSWAPAFRIQLHDHLFAEEVNRGLAAGLSFGAIFAGLDAGDDLEGLRETFAVKSFKRRQEAVLLGLRRAGLSNVEIVTMTVAALDAATLDGDAAVQKPRYREALAARFPDRPAEAPAFVTPDGQAIRPDRLGDHLAELRAVRISMEFNGALCRGLKHVRYKAMQPVGGEPTLVDFILDRVPG